VLLERTQTALPIPRDCLLGWKWRRSGGALPRVPAVGK
jgi:hypothetical protein